MLRELGTAGLRDVLEPAIAYARDGHPVLPRVVQSIAQLESFFRREWPTSAALWLDADEPWKRFRNPELAETYTRVLAEAERARGREAQIDAALDAWYRGFVAEAIGEFAATEVTDSSGRRHAGLLGADDLAAWQPTFEAPIDHEYGGWLVSKTGPWGQGPVFLQQLALLDGYDLGDASGPEFVHTVVECAKLAFARSRGLVRRSGLRRRPARAVAERRVRGGAPRARRRRGVGRAAPRARGRPPAEVRK